jgi:hypothetical protein
MRQTDALAFGHLTRWSDRPQAWFAVRDLLIEDVAEEPIGGIRTVTRNLQYAALRAFRGRGFQARALTERASVGQCLERAAVLLAQSVRADGTVDQARARAAASALPRFLRPQKEVGWTVLRDLVQGEWADANPLLGF